MNNLLLLPAVFRSASDFYTLLSAIPEGWEANRQVKGGLKVPFSACKQSFVWSTDCFIHILSAVGRVGSKPAKYRRSESTLFPRVNIRL